MDDVKLCSYIVHSIVKSEYMALCAICKGKEMLRKFLGEFVLWPQPIKAISLQYDCVYVLSQAYCDVYSAWTRHISKRFVMWWERWQLKGDHLKLVKSRYNLADPLSNPLSKELLKLVCNGMGLIL